MMTEQVLTEEEKRKKLEEEKEFTIRKVVREIFPLFMKEMDLSKKEYWLNSQALVCAISDAFTDIERVGSYHSKTGTNEFKKAAYIGKWVAEAKPIQVLNTIPVNLRSIDRLNSLDLNVLFAVYIVESFLGGEYTLYKELQLHLEYVFRYRHRMEASSIAMLLEHALDLSSRNK
jgi:hypothetical protein